MNFIVLFFQEAIAQRDEVEARVLGLEKRAEEAERVLEGVYLSTNSEIVFGSGYFEFSYIPSMVVFPVSEERLTLEEERRRFEEEAKEHSKRQDLSEKEKADVPETASESQPDVVTKKVVRYEFSSF